MITKQQAIAETFDVLSTFEEINTIMHNPNKKKTSHEFKKSTDNSPNYLYMNMNSCVNREDSPQKYALPVKINKSLQENSDGPDKMKARLDPNDEDDSKSVEPLSVATSLVRSDTKKKSASGDNEDTVKEESEDCTRTLVCTEKDVLSGRGGRTNYHRGNIYFRNLIVSQCPAYKKATKMMKPKVSRQIVKNIRERGGRFLRRGSDGTYYDIGESAALKKTSQGLRHRSCEIRNQLDPNRPNTNDRWTGRKEQLKDIIQNKPSSTNNSFDVPDTISIQYHLGQVNNAVAPQAPQFQSHGGRIDAPPLILDVGSAHHRNVEEHAMPLRQNASSHQSNESIQQQSRLLRSSFQYLDLLRFYEHNLPSSSLHNNSYTRSNVLLNATMHPMQSTQPSHVPPSIFQGNNNNLRNNYPTYPGYNNNARLINDVLPVLLNPTMHPKQSTQPSHVPPSIFQERNNNVRNNYPTVPGQNDNAGLINDIPGHNNNVSLINDVLPVLLNPTTHAMQSTQPCHVPPPISQRNSNNIRNNYPTVPGHNNNASIINDVPGYNNNIRLINDVLSEFSNPTTHAMQSTQPCHVPPPISQGSNHNIRNNYPTYHGHNDNARLIDNVTEQWSGLYNERNDGPPSFSPNPPR